MRVALFCHSLLSDYAHGSAHFLRGIVTELIARRHDVRVLEPRSAWSVESLVKEHGPDAIHLASKAYPRLRSRRYELATLDLDEVLESVDLAIVHAWNDPELIRRIAERRLRPGARCKALLYDTHRRSITTEAASAPDLSGYDGVLAAGAAAVEEHVKREFGRHQVWVWREAADPRVFFPRPAPDAGKRGDVVWIGNWKDEQRWKSSTSGSSRRSTGSHLPRRCTECDIRKRR